jgi:lipoprotein-anchoring transpeptidase ErfK/SrfK
VSEQPAERSHRAPTPASDQPGAPLVEPPPPEAVPPATYAQPPTSEVTGSGFFGAPKRLLVLGALVLLVVAVLAGVSYATYSYSRQYDGKILPGATIAGIDVTGMTPEQALRTVKKSIDSQLDRKLTVSWGPKQWMVTPRELGAQSNARAMVEEAAAASSDTSFLSLARMRILGAELDFDRSVAISHPSRGVRTFIEGIASNLDRTAADASLDYSTGWVKVIPEQDGRTVLVDQSRRSLDRALRRDRGRAKLAVEIEPAGVTTDAYDQVLLLRNGENKLYFYEDGKITHSYTVAAGLPEYPTPDGLFEVTEKRYLPTWINPDPKGWGKKLPKKIPPGPENPLGLRALNWSAPAIRFHGTAATYSLGYNASHGCVRMSNADVIELYNLVDVGAPIVSTVVAPLRPLYVSAPDPTLVPKKDPGKSDA